MLTEREKFESMFPMPPGCMHCGEGFAPTSYTAWKAHDYIEQWKGWRARALIESEACAERDACIAKKQARIDQLIQEVAAGADVEAKQRARIAELEQQLQAYEKHGVTCQTFRHFVSEPCAECNSPGRCAIKEQT